MDGHQVCTVIQTFLTGVKKGHTSFKPLVAVAIRSYIRVRKNWNEAPRIVTCFQFKENPHSCKINKPRGKNVHADAWLVVHSVWIIISLWILLVTVLGAQCPAHKNSRRMMKILVKLNIGLFIATFYYHCIMQCTAALMLVLHKSSPNQNKMSTTWPCKTWFPNTCYTLHMRPVTLFCFSDIF